MRDVFSGKQSRLIGLVLLLATAVGAFLRLYRIDSLPPAAGYDAAQYGLDALQILDGARPIFLAANFGREVLFSYLVAAVYLLIGPGSTGIFLSSALIGVATIPAVYLAGRALWAGDTTTEMILVRRWAPPLAALVTAVSYWHLNYSRAGLRVIWVPLFAALISAFLWHGIWGERRWSLALAGVLLGLSQYTYQAARLLPLLVGAGFMLTYLARRRFTRRDAADLLLTFGLALLVFAPLGRFALTQPEVFNDRLRQTALWSGAGTPSAQISAIGEQVTRALRMFFVEGDDEPLYTIPGRPSLNPFLAVFFLVGIGVAAWRWKRPSYLYLLTWLALLTAPAMIADQAATAKRALGAMPAAALLIGLGMAACYGWLARWRVGGTPGWVFVALLAVGLAWSAVTTYQDYFIRWGANPSLAAHYQRDHTEIGLAAGALPRDRQVLISPFSADHPAIQLLSGRHPNLRSYDGHRCLLLPGGQGGFTYLVVPGETERSLPQLKELYPAGRAESGPLRGDRDAPYYERFTVPAGEAPDLALPGSPALTWEDGLALRDTAVSTAQVRPGETLMVTLAYQALAEPGQNYTAYVHLQPVGDLSGAIASQSDSEPCGGALPTSRWQAGDIILDRIELAIPADALPGLYQLTTGFYRWPELTPLVLVGEGAPVIGQVEIRP